MHPNFGNPTRKPDHCPIRRIVVGSVLALACLAPGLGARSARAVRTDAEIRSILVERVDKYRQSVGIVVGVIEPQGRRVISYGKLASADPRPLNGDTIFEIGSITKVFTSLLLTDMVQRREVSLTDPVAKYLPPDVRLPERDQEQITFQDLATHTSGLPRMPLNVESRDPSNPYAGYSVNRLYDFLSRYELPRDIGSRFEYSNLGSALLGNVLAQRAGTSYETLVEKRIAEPLGMKSTRIALTPDMKARLAVGHAYGLEPTSNWDLGALGASGALRSSASDMLKFLAANLGYTRTKLSPAMAAMLRVRRENGRGQVALGWFVERRNGSEVMFHSGGTGGYLTFVGYDREARVGVVVLSNSGTGAGVDDIGFHLLNADAPLLDAVALTPPKERKAIAMDSKLLDAYVGRYRFPSSQIADVTREGDHLLLQPEGEVHVAFFPESRESFFAKLMDAQMSFRIDAQGRATEMIFHRNGADTPVKRVE